MTYKKEGGTVVQSYWETLTLVLRSGFISQLHPFPARCPEANYTSLSLRFLTCKKGANYST